MKPQTSRANSTQKINIYKFIAIQFASHQQNNKNSRISLIDKFTITNCQHTVKYCITILETHMRNQTISF